MVKRKKRYRIYLAAVIVCVVVFLGIFAHLFNGAPVGSTTFKAVITNIQGNIITVKGLENNKRNYRGELVFCVEKESRIVCRFTNIDLNKLETGDRVAVSFSGPVMETYPVQLGQVKQVRLNPL